MTTLLAWNILHGGGARRIPKIALVLLDHDADLILLSEYRTSMGGQLRGVLADHGWSHQASTNPPSNTNGLLIASRVPIEPITPIDPPESLAGRWLQIRIPDRDLFVLGAHIPEQRTGPRKASAWRYLLDAARRRLDARAVILGDLNTGRSGQDDQGSAPTCSAMMGELWSMGYRDAWREMHGPESREYSWYSHAGRGLRIDHAFVSPALSRSVRRCGYDHANRANRTSDHAPLILEIEGIQGSHRTPSEKSTQKTGLF